MSFASDIRKFADKTKLSLDTVHKKVIFDLVNAVVGMSPVNTGRFRNNWLISEGRINTMTTQGTDDPTGRLQALSQSVQLGRVVYITNSLPYAIPLEYGWSQQAPQGMVRLTVKNYQRYIRNAVRSIK